MISLVICSKIGHLSSFSAYEEGGMRSSFPIICFMHEDILYEAKGWG